MVLGRANQKDRVAVCSRSFSQNRILRDELLSRYKYVTFNEAGKQLEGDDLVAFLKGHTKAITALEKIDDRVLSALPELRVIGKYGVGLDMIDLDAMSRHGKLLGWTGGVNRRSVSEMVISFAILMLRHFPAAHREVLDGTWRQHVGGLLSGRTIGVIGCGFVGKDLITLLQPWGCKLLAHDIFDFPKFYSAHEVEAVPLEELLQRADVVSIHVPLNESTRNILSAKRLSLMKSDAILINTARGGLVEEEAVKSMLKTNKLGAAAFDVFEVEPPSDTELLKLSNFFATPHIGGSSAESILSMGRAAIDGLDVNEDYGAFE